MDRARWRSTAPLSGRRLRLYRALGLLFVAAALAGGSLLIWRAVDTRAAEQPLPGGLRTTGNVISVDELCGGRGGCTYQPMISYRVDGSVYIITGNIRDGRPGVGSSVPISYDPADPAHAHDLGGGAARWIGDAALGSFFASIGLWLVYMIATGPRRRRKHQAAAAAAAAPQWDPTWDESLRDAPRDDYPQR